MNLIEAIETGLPLHRKRRSVWTVYNYASSSSSTSYICDALEDQWIDPTYFLEHLVDREDVLANDYEVREPETKITKNQFAKVWVGAFGSRSHQDQYDIITSRLFDKV